MIFEGGIGARGDTGLEVAEGGADIAGVEIRVAMAAVVRRIGRSGSRVPEIRGVVDGVAGAVEPSADRVFGHAPAGGQAQKRVTPDHGIVMQERRAGEVEIRATGEVVIKLGGIDGDGHALALQIGSADGALGVFAGFVEGRQQDGDQQSDDRDDHQQFNKGNAAGTFFHDCRLHKR